MSNNGNGSNKILWFLLTVVSTVLLSVAAAWAIERNATDKELAARITALETQYATINTKLDQLLEQHRAAQRIR